MRRMQQNNRVGEETKLICYVGSVRVSIPISLCFVNGAVLWLARNLKFYPFAIRNAMAEGGPLDFIRQEFQVPVCKPGSDGKPVSKLLKDLTTWEMLNLRVSTVLDMPDRLYREYNVSSEFVGSVMGKYSIQSVGRHTFETKYRIEQPIQYLLSATRHYSWPKGCGKLFSDPGSHHLTKASWIAVTGIGSENCIGLPIDHGARVKVDELEKYLAKSLGEERAVYAVVAIIGSTEEGCVDPLAAVINLREKYLKLGLSFVVHADAVWGAYFCTMLPPPGTSNIVPVSVLGELDGVVPDSSLRNQTQADLFAIRYADSVTVDPHKSGYVPYPAGGLCYRDGLMRYLVTWKAPYIIQDPTTNHQHQCVRY